jgi:hypothetical protein
MSANSTSLNDEIFDLILTKALKEDCEREFAMYERMASEVDPSVFDKKFERGIDKIRKSFRRKERSDKLKKIAPRLATAALIIIMIVSLATNPAVATFFSNIYARLTGDYMQHEFVSSEDVTIETFNGELRPAYLPDGFRIQSVWYSFAMVAVDYVDDEYNTIIFEYQIASDTIISVRFEHAVQHIMSVNGKDAIFYESTDTDFPHSLVWYNRGYSFVLLAQISLEEFVQIAESIEIP